MSRQRQDNTPSLVVQEGRVTVKDLAEEGGVSVPDLRALTVLRELTLVYAGATPARNEAVSPVDHTRFETTAPSRICEVENAARVVADRKPPRTRWRSSPTRGRESTIRRILADHQARLEVSRSRLNSKE